MRWTRAMKAWAHAAVEASLAGQLEPPRPQELYAWRVRCYETIAIAAPTTTGNEVQQ